ncbi:hypothetical protein CAPTEDRAFT_198099 [Capitella teleta]|uniref:Uncharacterized protein n=1 Tax=Capitella teleta TaxID=283909 RepID=X1ZYA4_CAPTE|nr:hypothetical protein CAPTEDRAFT_198099 [Capitella teleta]|eukprot:ELU04647.1 hypothetical protein CAPTEDRAFT_198099 [Capitella teleta]
MDAAFFCRIFCVNIVSVMADDDEELPLGSMPQLGIQIPNEEKCSLPVKRAFIATYHSPPHRKRNWANSFSMDRFSSTVEVPAENIKSTKSKDSSRKPSMTYRSDPLTEWLNELHSGSYIRTTRSNTLDDGQLNDVEFEEQYEESDQDIFSPRPINAIVISGSSDEDLPVFAPPIREISACNPSNDVPIWIPDSPVQGRRQNRQKSMTPSLGCSNAIDADPDYDGPIQA